MAAETGPFLTVGELCDRLHSLCEWAKENAPTEIYVDLIETCVICEALADANGDWNKTVDVSEVAARLKREGIHLVPRSAKDHHGE
jgi:hypothetical protein